jgi:uroporphyrinogen-III synthase
MAKLIEKQGGVAQRAPSMREVPLSDQREALEFAERLLAGHCHVLVLLTGVGLRSLMDAMQLRHSKDDLVRALSDVALPCRGPKPVKVLKELGLKPTLVAPEPNTSRQLLDVIEADLPVSGKNVCVQEYGAATPMLLDGLTAMGAHVSRVGVYRWQLPEDVEPLKRAVSSLCAGEVDVTLFTSAQQVLHLLQVAEESGQVSQTLDALCRTLVGSIGPVTSDALREAGVSVDTEPEHPKMGQLVSHVARFWAQRQPA